MAKVEQRNMDGNGNLVLTGFKVVHIEVTAEEQLMVGSGWEDDSNLKNLDGSGKKRRLNLRPIKEDVVVMLPGE